jgi:sirohydrochlorin cobaltochelatase
LNRPKVVLIVSHGSREASANQEFMRLVGKFRKRHPSWKVAHAFLDVVEPSIPMALEELARGKTKEPIDVLPYFLFRARHVKKDIPAILKAFAKNHPKLKLRLAQPLGDDARILDILDRRLVH